MAMFRLLIVYSFIAILFHTTLGIVTDPCDPDPCQNGATCSSGTNSTGTNSTGTNSTATNSTGTSSTTYQCTCTNGYSGTNCEYDPCFSNPCVNGGTCQVRPTSTLGYVCRCRRNYAGTNCQRDAFACRSSPCLNGGTCKNRPATGSYICRCQPGTFGNQCEINEDDCLSSPCQNNATCTDLAGGFVCTCPKGMVGQFCEMDFSSQIEVSCNAREMTIKVAPGLLYAGDVPSSMHLNNANCTGYAQDQSIILSTPYGECGTIVEESGETIIFSNTLLYTKQIITTHNYLQIPVQCILGKKEIVDGSSYGITREYATAIKGYAQFELTLERYSNESFTALPSSGNVRVRDELFYAVSLDSTANLTVLIDACWATPSEDANDTLRYDLIMDGCPVDSSLNIFTNLGSLKQGFSFQAFAFIGGYPQVHVHCAVTMCVTNGNGCQQGCNSITPQRRRRSLGDAPGLMSNAISSEPIILNYDV